MTRGLILLAGTSEAGKSTAGAHLAARGTRHVKIRSVLTALTTGIPVEHEGVPMREGFDPAEFVTTVVALPAADDPPVLVIESFIDAALAEATRRAWPGPARITFVTAARAVRIRRMADDRQISVEQAAMLVDAKDSRKRVFAQWTHWRRIADDWIDNDSDLPMLLAGLDRLLTTTQATLDTVPRP